MTEEPGWLRLRINPRLRWAMLVRLALRMCLHDRQQTGAAVFGIAFAYLLVGQQASTVFHFLDQQTAYIKHAGADIWIVPPGEKAFFVGSSLLPASSLHHARSASGVRWAEPVVRGSSWVRLPDGGASAVLLVGVTAPELRGGPFALVAGERSALLKPNAVVVDDAEREKLGGLNLGDMVELNGARARVEGLTWGLVTSFGSFAFAEYDFARSILEVDSDRLSCVLIGLEDDAQLLRVQSELRGRIADASVLTTAEYLERTYRFMLFDVGTGAILIMGIAIGVVVGLGVVGLAMLSSVQQNIREFGTLKAIGATNADLRFILRCQALGYSLLGSLLGAGVLSELTWASRTPQLILIVHPWMYATLLAFVLFISLTAAKIALRGVERVDPASVFK